MKEEAASVNWHAMDVKSVLEHLDSGENGLDEAQAKQRLGKAGPNALEAEDGVSPLRLLARQVHNPLIYLLVGAAVLSFVIGHRVGAGVIAGVVILNTLLGFIQAWRAEGALKALREMSAHHARVLRSGTPLEIEASQVVPGDVLALETGDRVAADARILSGDNLRVDESALTGESQSVAKQPENAAEDAPLADRHNMVWMSTNITGGRGRAVVVETGMRTVVGMIAGEVRATFQENTPLQKRMQKLDLFWYARQNGELVYARTVAFIVMVAFQWFHAFNARSNFLSVFSNGVLSNRPLLVGVGAAILLQIAAVHTPTGQKLLGTTGLSGMDWLLIVLVASSIWVADEIFKPFGAHGKPRRNA